MDIALYICMGVGALLIVLGIVGCVGATRLSSCLLGMFAFIVIIVIAALIAGGVLAYLYRAEARNQSENQIEGLMIQYHGLPPDHPNVRLLDALQQGLGCCGTTGPRSWLDIAAQKRSVPASCCRDPNECRNQGDITSLINAVTSEFSGAIGQEGKIYTEGCADKLRSAMETGVWTIVGVLAGAAVIQLFGFIGAVSLCCAL